MRKITEIKTSNISGINVISLLGEDILFIVRNTVSHTYFTSYMGNVYYSEQKLSKTAFKQLVEEVKTVAKSVEIIDLNNHPKSNAYVCTIYRTKHISKEAMEAFSEETLIKSAVAAEYIEQPFAAPSEFEGDIEELKKTMGL